MKYRTLTFYRYMVMSDYVVQTDIYPPSDLIFEFMELSTTGQLSVKRGYAWDGVTGFMIVPKCLLRGSLIHDVFYQFMRLGVLDQSTNRILADRMLKKTCLEDGALRILSSLIYLGARLLGKLLLYKEDKEVVTFEAP
ncbi:MAG: hypothetical protein WC919_06250 [Candidatus Paceibacterota bacterium]